MALIAHQTQGPYPILSLRRKPWMRGPKMRSFTAFPLVDGKGVPLRRRFSLRSQPLNLSKGKAFQVLSFKGNAQHDESNNSDSCSKFSKTPVQISLTQDEREVIAECHGTLDHSIPCISEDREDNLAGSNAIRKLFEKWLLMLRAQSSSQTDAPLGERLSQTEASEGRLVTPRMESTQLLKLVMMHFIRLDAAISLPLLIFVPFYLGVRVIHGAGVTKELAPMWVLGPLIIALQVKIVQGLYSLSVLCLMYVLGLVKTLPSVYDYIAKGGLKAFLWALFWRPIEGIVNLDYRDLFVRKTKQLQELAVEKYLDYIESIWPLYCRTIRFLKKANLL